MENTNIQTTEVSDNTNTENSSSQKDGFFGLHQRGTTIKKEIMAGVVIFLSMFYIVGVQMSMFGSVQTEISAGAFGITTALAAGITTIFMGLYANHPASLAPGMGVNAFVAFTLIAGGMDVASALSAVLVSGLIFIIISVTPVRGAILRSIPDDLKKSISVGVGLFLLFVALADGGIITNSAEVDWSTGGPLLVSPGTPTTLGNLADPFVFLSLFGIVITIIFWVLEIPAGVLIAMGITAILGVVFSAVGLETKVSDPSGFPVSLPQLTFDSTTYTQSFKDVGSLFGAAFKGFGNVDKTWANPTWYMAIFTLFLMDFFDTAGTLFGLNSAMEDIEVTEQTNKRVLIVDAVGTAGGAILGSTNITTFAETATGIQAGGRTGLTSITVGVLFLISVPIIPLLTPLLTYSVTAGPIFLIGIAMASNLNDFNTEDKTMLASSITTIMFMILGYSIGLGIVMGLLLYIILMLVTGRFAELDWVLLATSPLFLAFLILPVILEIFV